MSARAALERAMSDRENAGIYHENGYRHPAVAECFVCDALAKARAAETPLLVLTLVAPPDKDGRDRRSAAVLDAETGRFVAIERYSEDVDGQLKALERLLVREKLDGKRLVPGPTIRIPAVELYAISDSLSNRAARRQRARERYAVGAPMRPDDIPGRQTP